MAPLPCPLCTKRSCPACRAEDAHLARNAAPAVAVPAKVVAVERYFSPEELGRLMDADALTNVVERGNWRHGHTETIVVELDGAHWLLTLQVHHEDGFQLDVGVTATKVAQVPRTVLVWEMCP